MDFFIQSEQLYKRYNMSTEIHMRLSNQNPEITNT